MTAAPAGLAAHGPGPGAARAEPHGSLLGGLFSGLCAGTAIAIGLLILRVRDAVLVGAMAAALITILLVAGLGEIVDRLYLQRNRLPA